MQNYSQTPRGGERKGGAGGGLTLMTLLRGAYVWTDRPLHKYRLRSVPIGREAAGNVCLNDIMQKK